MKNRLGLVLILGLMLLIVGCGEDLPKDNQDQTKSTTQTEQKTEQKAAAYQLGTVINFFGAGNNSLQYIGKGWSRPEKNFTWTNGKEATLNFEISDVNKDLLLKVNSYAFIVRGKVEEQNVTLLANGQNIGQWQYSSTKNKGERTATVSKSIIKDNKLILTFQIPDSAVPKEQGFNNDTRTLGIAVSTIVIE